MSSHNFAIRPLLLSEIDHFIDANIQVGFLSSDPQNIAYFKKAISLAKHIAILEVNKKIKGGIMLFQRWHNAIWATNIFVDPSIQSQGTSIALYKYALHYCSNIVPWAFCNPIGRITSLHERWGIVSLNYWESVSLVAIYNYFFKVNPIDIAFPFRTTSQDNILQAENKDMVIKIMVDQQLLQVSYKHTLRKKQTISLHDAYRLRLNSMPAHVGLAQDWVFDPQNGLIIHKKKKIIIYAPTAGCESLLGLTIPMDDVKKPKHWNYTNNALEVIYPTLKKDIQVALLATFNERGITLSISVPEGYKPRLTIAHDAISMIRLMDHPKATIETVKYNHCLHTIYNGITHKFIAHLIDLLQTRLLNGHFGVEACLCSSNTAEYSGDCASPKNCSLQIGFARGLIDTDPLHKKFLRTFIPRSHRPYIGRTNAYESVDTLPLAAMLLDPTQRHALMHTPLLSLSERGHQILNQIKTDLYATKS